MSRISRLWAWLIVILVGIALLVFLIGPSLFESVAYPLPTQYQKTIANEAKNYGISPNLAAALIFVESGFSPSAHSYAGALGLTQVMPSTGVAIAGRLGIKNFKPSDLTANTDLAIKFGIYYISDAIKRYGGDKTLGLIAYNGGGGAVMAYQRGYPVKGTVAYAQKIIAIEKAYDSIYGRWWEKVDFTVSSPNAQFNVTPKPQAEIVGSLPIVDFWRTLLTSTPASQSDSSVDSFWRNLIPTQ